MHMCQLEVNCTALHSTVGIGHNNTVLCINICHMRQVSQFSLSLSLTLHCEPARVATL